MDDARRIASTFFGQPPDELLQIDGLGSVNRVFVARSDHRRVVVRIPLADWERAIAIFDKERWCLEKAKEVGVVGPTVLAGGKSSGVPFQILSYVEGRNGGEFASKRNPIWTTLGKYASRFHEVAIDGFGENLSDFQSGEGVGGWQRCIDYNRASLTADDSLISLGVYTPDERENIDQVFERLRTQPVRIGLCHGDLAPQNILISEIGVVALIDWGCAEAHVVPHFDLLQIPAEFQSAFLDGYGIAPIDRIPLMRELNDLRLLKSFDLVRWALDRCPARIEELAERARSCWMEFA